MYRLIKRILDFFSASILFIVISPLFVFLMFLVRIKLGRPVFFKQVRSGLHQKHFSLIKFRTMTDARDANGELLPDSERFTEFGHWMRSTSLDELPELLNIVVGNMSVIGPRPLPSRYDPFYSARECKRFQVRSGLISPESVDRNPFISWDKQLEYDVTYVENLSLKEDLRILCLVFRMLFRRYEDDLGGWTREALDVERSKGHLNNNGNE